jgi:hypothetical protein
MRKNRFPSPIERVTVAWSLLIAGVLVTVFHEAAAPTFVLACKTKPVPFAALQPKVNRLPAWLIVRLGGIGGALVLSTIVPVKVPEEANNKPQIIFVTSTGFPFKSRGTNSIAETGSNVTATPACAG